MRPISAKSSLEGTLKRSAVVVAVAGLLVTMLGIIAPASSNAASSDSASAAVTCKLKGFRKVVCPTAKLRGPRGPAGATGPAGPAGPAGSAGSGATAVNPFKFLATGNTANTTIATLTGAVAESGCNGGTFTNIRLRGTADNGSAQTVRPRSVNVEDFAPDLDTGESITLRPGGTDDLYNLTYMSAGGAQMASALYSAHDGAAIGGVFDCAIYGTISVS